MPTMHQQMYILLLAKDREVECVRAMRVIVCTNTTVGTEHQSLCENMFLVDACDDLSTADLSCMEQQLKLLTTVSMFPYLYSL